MKNQKEKTGVEDDGGKQPEGHAAAAGKKANWVLFCQFDFIPLV